MMRLLSIWNRSATAFAGCALAASALANDWRASPTLSRIADKNTIHVGYIPTPGTFAFKDEQGQTVGYSIDLCWRVIEAVRAELKRPDIKPTFKPVEPSQRIPLLQSGGIDIECGANTNTAARQEKVDFSHTFFQTGARLAMRKGEEVDRPIDLWRKKVAVTKGTTAESLVQQRRVELDVTVVTVASDLEGMKLLESRQVDAFAQDDILLYALVAQSSVRNQLVVTGKFMSVEPYAFMLPKGDTTFVALVDKTLLGLIRSGEMVNLYKKWFDTDKLRIPMNVYMKENLRFPNKYGIP
jgi:glutamate/aspartate transport system substrate-binding protein